MPNYKNIPEELRGLEQWVCANRDSKVPMKAFANEAASSTKSDTWSDFDTALDAVNKRHYDYCGFVFNDNGIVGIDIDDGYDDNGLINVLSADILGACESYTEKSRSGRGFHILLRGTLPFKGRNNLKGVEIYQAGRYFIMTGDVLLFEKIEDNQKAIDYVLETYFSEERSEKTNTLKDRIYQPVWGNIKNGNRIKLRPTYPSIEQGCRNLSLTSLAGSMHVTGYSKKQIFEELIIANKQACNPPLSTTELQTICNSVTRYKR